MSKTFAERNPVVLGVVCSALLVASLVLSLDIKHLPFIDSGDSYAAEFSESGGLSSGDDVVVAGLAVGSVTSVALDHGHVRVGFEITEDGVRLGDRTRASITTLTVLGKRGLKLVSDGGGKLAGTIPLSRTTPPYDLTDALSGLATTTASIDSAAFAQALRTMTAAFKDTPAPLQGSVQGLSRIARTLATRDDEIGSLLSASNRVTLVLAQRDAQIRTLLGDGARLLAELDQRRRTIASLLVSVRRLADQISGLVDDDQRTLGPALQELKQVTDLLNRNKRNVEIVLDRAGPFAASLGEAVSSGPFFQAYVQNLTRPLELTGLGGG